MLQNTRNKQRVLTKCFIYIMSINGLGINKVNMELYGQTNNVQGSSNVTKPNSIFSVTKNADKSDTDQEVMKQIASEQKRLITEYNCTNYQKKAKQVEEALKNSHVPNLSQVSKSLTEKIGGVIQNIQNIFESLSTSLSGCKTEQEVNSAVEKIEQQLQQEKSKAAVYAQRGESAKALHFKLDPLYKDPEKTKLLEKIDINKITSELEEEPNLASLSENDNASSGDKKLNTNDKLNDLLEDDKISNVVTSLIKYLNNGEKDKILDDYVKGDNTQEKESIKNNNLFTTDFMKKKNPFST